MKGWESSPYDPRETSVTSTYTLWMLGGGGKTLTMITKEHNCKTFIICLLSSILILLQPACNQPECEIMFSALTMPFAAANPCRYCYSAAEQTAKVHIS